MEINIQNIARRAKRLGTALRNFPLYALVIGAQVALEIQSGGTIVMLNTHEVLGVQLGYVEAAFCLMFGLLSSYMSVQASALKSDPRYVQRRRASGARLVSVLLLAVPVFYLASAFQFQHQLAVWSAYVGSAEHATDLAAQALAQTQRELGEVAANLSRATEPNAVSYDGMFFLYLFGAACAYGLCSVTIGAGWQPKPETTWEAKERLKDERAAKARRTKQRNAAEKEAQERAANRPSFIRAIFTGGRKAA